MQYAPTDPGNSAQDDDMSKPQQLAALLMKLSPEERATFMSLINNSDDVAEDDEETGATPNASNKERNDLGIDKARRLAADKSLKDQNSFTSRYGDRIKIDTMGVK